MPDDLPVSLTSAKLAEVDSRYVPFPSFREWPSMLPNPDAWETSRSEFERAIDNATEDDLKHAQTVALRAAAFDTGAIEGLYPTDRGLTLTVATQVAAWEQKVAESSVDARALFEAQLQAFELVLDHATKRFPKVTQTWVRRLHEEITAAQDTYTVHTPVGPQEQPLPKGEYKEHPNHVLGRDDEIHPYAPVHQTQAEMQRLVDELESSAFRDAHPVLQASYAHYALVAIHPFADGNGRVARAVASAYTYRAASVPLLVLADRRNAYLAALSQSDDGDATSFVDFIASAVQEAMELVVDSLLTAGAPQPETQLEGIERLYHGYREEENLDKVASEFASWLHQAAGSLAKSLPIPESVQLSASNLGRISPKNLPEGFRSIQKPMARSIRFNISSTPPAQYALSRQIDVLVTRNGSKAETLMLRAHETDERLTLSMNDMWPQLSGVAQHRAENFLRRVLGEGLLALRENVSSQFNSQGP